MLERESWAALGINVVGLDKFNEIYGFVARDDVLRAIALTLTSAVDELGSIDDFVGHPAESQFVIITVPNKMQNLGAQISERLNQAMTYFYPIHDREAGFVRRGEDEADTIKVPFMSIAIASLSHKNDAVADVDTLKQALSQPLRV